MFSRKDCSRYLEFSFRPPTLVTNNFWENKVLTVQRLCKTARRPLFLNFAFVVVCIARICTLFLQMKKVNWPFFPIWWVTQHGKFSDNHSLWPQWLCWAAQTWGTSWPFGELHGRFVFLPWLMATFRRRATNILYKLINKFPGAGGWFRPSLDAELFLSRT